jgi:hypothetical protein
MGKIYVVAAPPKIVAVEREEGTVMEEKYDLESYEYRYSPLFPSTESGFAECCAWVPNNIEGLVVLETTIWYVYDLFTKTVPRNRRWWAEVGQPAYEEFWREVEAARLDGRYGEKALFVSESDSDSDKEMAVVAPAAADGGWLGVDSD